MLQRVGGVWEEGDSSPRILVAGPYPRGAMLWCTGAMQRRGYRRVAGAMIQRLVCLSSPRPSALRAFSNLFSELALIASQPSCQGSRRDSIHIGKLPRSPRLDDQKVAGATEQYCNGHHSTFSFCICMIFAYLALNTHQTHNPLFSHCPTHTHPPDIPSPTTARCPPRRRRDQFARSICQGS